MQPGKMKQLLEGLARIVEDLIEEMHRRGAVPETDLEDYERYRELRPREDA